MSDVSPTPRTVTVTLCGRADLRTIDTVTPTYPLNDGTTQNLNVSGELENGVPTVETEVHAPESDDNESEGNDSEGDGENHATPPPTGAACEPMRLTVPSPSNGCAYWHGPAGQRSPSTSSSGSSAS